MVVDWESGGLGDNSVTNLPETQMKWPILLAMFCQKYNHCWAKSTDPSLFDGTTPLPANV